MFNAMRKSVTFLHIVRPKSTKTELVTEKRRKDLEMNRSVIMPEKEAEITSIGDIVNKQMVHLMLNAVQ
jgi:hypothetical protein